MTNALQPTAAAAALAALFPNTAKIRAVSSGYVYSSAHDFFDDVVSGNRLGASVALSGLAYTAGVLTFAGPTITGLSNLDVIRGFWIYNDTGVESTSRLVAWFDTDSAGAPINYTSDGSNLPLSWPGVTVAQI